MSDLAFPPAPGSNAEAPSSDYHDTAGLTANDHLVAALDIGTSRIACVIYALPRKRGRGDAVAVQRPRFLGVGTCKSAGVKAGIVTDLDAAERAVRIAVENAERMADVTLDSVAVSVSCGRLKSEMFVARDGLEKGRVSDRDLKRVFAAGRAHAERDGRRVLLLDALGYRLDAEVGISDPRGMAGQELGIEFHAVTADEQPLRNLRVLIERCFLDLDGIVVAPQASGLITTTEDERTLGVTCIDIGGGTTTISMFFEERFVGADALAFGGDHITFDIARALSTPVSEAERIKTLHGGLIEAASDHHEMISYPSLGEEVMLHQINRAQLLDLIRPRYEQILQMVRERVMASGLKDYVGGRFVITGGASQMPGLDAFASDFMRRPVRLGVPEGASLISVPPRLSLGSLSAPLGAIALMAVRPSALASEQNVGEAFRIGPEASGSQGTYLKRVGQWFRESF